MRVYIESGVAMAHDDGVAAWSFDLAHWGRCGQGRTESDALTDLTRQTSREAGSTGPPALIVGERVTGDEQAFERDLLPATAAERGATLRILAGQRAHLVRLLERYRDVLDTEDPSRDLPRFASWRTLRQMAWHIADTESRYYLPSLGLPARDRATDLDVELRESAEHVTRVVRCMPATLVRDAGGEVWSTVKVLRRLAWHERGELVAMRAVARSLTDR